MMKFKVVLEEAEEGGYVVYVPALPGCVSQGETKEEAIENIKEAIEVTLISTMLKSKQKSKVRKRRL